MQSKDRRRAEPPYTHTRESNVRRVGVEVEFGGLEGARAAELVRDLFGGTVVCVEPFAWKVEDTRLGTFEVEMDWRYVHLLEKDTIERARSGDPVAKLKEGLTKVVGTLGSRIMPFEVKAPPLPFDQLGEIEDLVISLREHHACGTRSDVLHAFALQLNPEAPSLEVDDILTMFRAYLLMSDWLRREIQVDLTRRISTMIEPFPEAYARKVLAPDYAPRLGEFIDDYLLANPTRNRELDLLPLFAHLDDKRVRSRVHNKLVRARPTYHYRLPDCRLDDPDWGVLLEWARWVEVERLAASPGRLSDLTQRFLDADRAGRASWAETVDRYIR